MKPATPDVIVLIGINAISTIMPEIIQLQATSRHTEHLLGLGALLRHPKRLPHVAKTACKSPNGVAISRAKSAAPAASCKHAYSDHGSETGADRSFCAQQGFSRTYLAEADKPESLQS
jgi:hypothetical protein